MKDLMMINPTGVTRLFRFVTPAALNLLSAAGWKPLLSQPEIRSKVAVSAPKLTGVPSNHQFEPA